MLYLLHVAFRKYEIPAFQGINLRLVRGMWKMGVVPLNSVTNIATLHDMCRVFCVVYDTTKKHKNIVYSATELCPYLKSIMSYYTEFK
jgi:hypothetical protein